MLVFYPFSLMATLLLGMPVFLALKWFQLVAWWSALASGFFVGAVMVVALRLPYLPTPEDFLKGISTFGPLGALAGFAFWLIWRRGTDPQVAANSDTNGT